MSELAAILFSACLINNLILDHALGVSPALALSGKTEIAAGLARVMLCLLPFVACCTTLVNDFLLQPAGLEHLQIISLPILLAVGTLGGLALIRRGAPQTARKYEVLIPLALFNTAVLGTALLTLQYGYPALTALCFGLGAGAGFGLVLVMLAELEQRIHQAEIPASFRGLPISLITLAILSMAFSGLAGLGSR